MMRCIEKSSLKLNKDKCVFMAEEVKFLGHVLSGDGIRPDPEKVKQEDCGDAMSLESRRTSEIPGNDKLSVQIHK